MKITYFLIGIIFCNQLLIAQKLDVESQRFIGEKGNEYQFFQYKQRTGLIKPHIVNYRLNEDLSFIQQDYEPWYSDEVKILKHDEIELFFHYRDNKLKVIIGDRDSTYAMEDDIGAFGNKFFAFDLNSDSIFISAHSEASIYLFNKNTFEFTPLPLTGSNLHIRGNYLFFETPRYSDNYSSFPKDVYRVRLDDLKNPEKVLIQVNKWYPYTENVLYASTDPFLKINDNNSYGFYNLEDQMVAESPGIATQDIIEIKGEPYLLKIAEKNGEKIFRLEELPTLPKIFPYRISETDNQKPRGKIFQWYNIPLKEKTMIGTVLTQYLMYGAPESKLRELTKSQLRFLRNAFYAFQGYKFESEELTEYFNYFDWYKKMTMGEKSNEDVVIWSDEKERAELIKRIEESKN